jgi:hypothetical protein
MRPSLGPWNRRTRVVCLRFLRSADAITDTSVALPSQSQATDADAWLADLDTASPDLRHRSRLFLNQDRMLFAT